MNEIREQLLLLVVDRVIETNIEDARSIIECLVASIGILSFIEFASLYAIFLVFLTFR